jgi:hypothetical protein
VSDLRKAEMESHVLREGWKTVILLWPLSILCTQANCQTFSSLLIFYESEVCCTWISKMLSPTLSTARTLCLQPWCWFQRSLPTSCALLGPVAPNGIWEQGHGYSVSHSGAEETGLVALVSSQAM